MRLNSLGQNDIKNRPDVLPFELSFCDYNMKNLNKIQLYFFCRISDYFFQNIFYLYIFDENKL